LARDVSAKIDVDLQLGLGAAGTDQNTPDVSQREDDERRLSEPRWARFGALPEIDDGRDGEATDVFGWRRRDAIYRGQYLRRALHPAARDRRLRARPDPVLHVERGEAIQHARARRFRLRGEFGEEDGGADAVLVTHEVPRGEPDRLFVAEDEADARGLFE